MKLDNQKITSAIKYGPHINDNPNFLLKSLAEANVSFGTFLMLPGIHTAKVVAQSGLDFVLIDGEHGHISDDSMHIASSAVVSHKVSPIVRIPGDEAWMIKRALDSGAHGIMVPMVNNAQQASQIAQASKFAPSGIRGQGSPFAGSAFGQSQAEYFLKANSQTLVIVQIETKEAIQNVDEIAATDGVDVLFIGPNDLAANLHYIPGTFNQEINSAIQKVLDACKKHGKIPGILAANGTAAKEWKQKGFKMIGISSDAKVLTMWYNSHLGIAKE